MNGAERLDFNIAESDDDDPGARRLRRRQRDRAMIDRGDGRLLERREHVRDADGECLDVAAAERESEEERREKTCRETAHGS